MIIYNNNRYLIHCYSITLAITNINQSIAQVTPADNFS